MNRTLFDRALYDPGAVFDGPEDVLASGFLTDEQKIEVLLRWEDQAADEDVALEEGMPGDDTDMTRRILVALGALVGPMDLERTGPSKQHGLARRAIIQTK